MFLDQGFKAKILAILTLALVFGSGMGLGLAWDRDLIAGPPDGDEKAQEDDGADQEGRSGRREMIVEQVGLTVEQKAAVDETVVEQRQRMKVIQEEFKDIERQFNERYLGVIRDTREAIKDHLTEEQRSQYDVLLAEHDERRRERREQRRRDREHPNP
jgi:hypothetical protein